MYVEKIVLPKNIIFEMKGNLATVKGEKGSINRTFFYPGVNIKVAGDEVTLYSDTKDKKSKAVVNCWLAHIKNMIEGVANGHKYKMKIIYSHFPIKVLVKGENVLIENFLGEKRPRKAKIVGKTNVDIKSDSIIVSGIDIEDVGQTCANIELATRIKNRDPRVFQDGIYIVEKGVKNE
ncbi:MAG: 50S ribosomal protein L6 [Candidatus Thermoplasmatota archaeon]